MLSQDEPDCVRTSAILLVHTKTVLPEARSNADGEEAGPIRDRGGVGEADRLDVPALQRRPGQEKNEMLEGNRCLLRIKVIRIRT